MNGGTYQWSAMEQPSDSRIAGCERDAGRILKRDKSRPRVYLKERLVYAFIMAIFQIGCVHQPQVRQDPLDIPEEIYVNTQARPFSPSKVGVFRFSEPLYATHTGETASRAIYNELLITGVFPNVINEIEHKDIGMGHILDLAWSKEYDLIITGDVLYYFDGSDLTASRVDERVRVTHVATKETLWLASVAEIGQPVLPVDGILPKPESSPAPPAIRLLKGNAKRFCNMFLVQTPQVFSPSRDSDWDGLPDEMDQCPDTPRRVEVDEKGCPVDSDADLVPDYLDRCPHTPKDVDVDESGCPIDSDTDGVPDYIDQCPDTPEGVAVDENGCPTDSDADGVPDYLDQCPDTPENVAVNGDGCPPDTDEDGVPDYLDKCPDTPYGASVNEAGCWVCKGVKFDFGSAHIEREFYPNLDEVVHILKETLSLNIEVQGHTDSIGTKPYNQKLSERRAKSVINYLTRKGISSKRLIAKGYGFTEPMASNETKEGRERNRRVQLKPIR
jgi:outer membrane protein OmpA-like peptidoglycan-associated protein